VLECNTLLIANVAKKVNSSHVSKCRVFCSASCEHDGVKSLVGFSYKESKVREMAAHMMLFHEYPFNMMEYELFNEFMRIYTPH
jgi:hypothetical protein